MKIELANNNQSQEIATLIDDILKEYGDAICLHGVDREILDFDYYFRNKGGEFWVAINDKNEIVGTIGLKPINEEEKIIELKKLYLLKSTRGTGLSIKLVDLVEEWSIINGYKIMELWSDTRFDRAHHFYKKLNYKQLEIRHMDDGNVPYSEYRFIKEL